MPCISGNYNPVVGPIIDVAIIDPKITSTGLPRFYNALIDTEATSTCISDKVVTETGLAPSGKVMMMSTTGETPMDQFTFGVGLLITSEQQPTGETMGKLVVRHVRGCLFHGGNLAFDVLLGRDVICSGVFTLSFDGHFVLSI